MGSLIGRQQEIVVSARKVGIDVDVQSLNQVAVEFKDVAIAPLTFRASRPCSSVREFTRLDSFHDETAALLREHHPAWIVRESRYHAGKCLHERHKL